MYSNNGPVCEKLLMIKDYNDPKFQLQAAPVNGARALSAPMGHDAFSNNKFKLKIDVMRAVHKLFEL